MNTITTFKEMMRGWKIPGRARLKRNETNVFICRIVNSKLTYHFSKLVGTSVSIYLTLYA